MSLPALKARSPAAVEQHGADGGVVVDLEDQLVHAVVHRHRHGVELVGTVEDEVTDVAVLLEAHVAVSVSAHGGFSSLGRSQAGRPTARWPLRRCWMTIGDDEQGALGDVLPERVDAEDGQPVAQDAEQDDGEDGAGDRALAARAGPRRRARRR